VVAAVGLAAAVAVEASAAAAAANAGKSLNRSGALAHKRSAGHTPGVLSRSSSMQLVVLNDC
jgi:hypothetical protein